MQLAPGTPARAGRVWPAMGVKVELTENQSPQAVYDRDLFSNAEAITFDEFALESAVREPLNPMPPPLGSGLICSNLQRTGATSNCAFHPELVHLILGKAAEVA